MNLYVFWVEKILYSDAHCHVNPVRGLGARILGKKFKDAGGWFIAIVGLSPSNYGYEPTYEGYLKSFNLIIKECRELKKLGLEIICLAGFHPADVNKLVSLGKKPLDVLNLAIKVLNYLEKLIRKGELNGLGEFGRPHFKTDPVVTVLNELILIEALKKVKDLNTLIHLHLEQGGSITVLSIEKLVGSVGINKNKVILHHCNSETAIAGIKKGFPVTVVGKQKLLLKIKEYLSSDFLLIESDFLDDNRRPGVVMYPWEIPETINNLVKNGIISDRIAEKLMVTNVARIYEI